MEGAKQLEGTPVDRGIVAVNLANVFPHMEMFRRNFGSSDEATAYVYSVFNRFGSRFHQLVGDSRLAILQGRYARQGPVRAVLLPDDRQRRLASRTLSAWSTCWTSVASSTRSVISCLCSRCEKPPLRLSTMHLHG